MSSHFTIAIYQRKEGRALDWITVGLGPLTEEQQGQSAVKMQRKLLDRLRRAIGAAEPETLEHLQLARGTRLDRLRLELNVKSEGGTKRLAGLFPVVSEPRWLGDGEQVRILYHPLRQTEWLALPLEEPLEEPLAAFFKHEWAGLSADDLEELKSNGKDSLRSVSFSATPRCLTDTLGQTDKEQRRQKRRGAVLAQIGTDSTRRVIEETASLGMPRSPYRAQMQLLLGAGQRRPAIVVGEPGCGKTTVIERWIRDLADEEAYPIHRNLDKIHHVWTIAGKRLIAGMSHLGDWEKRCIDLLEEAKRRRAILWVEDLHLFGRLGQTRDSDRSLADFFRGPIARGELVIVGESTLEQLQRLEDDAPSFAALFSRVRIEATTPSETLQMAISESRRLELEYGCVFHPFAFRTVLEVGGSLFPWKAFPGKALDIVRRLADSAGGRGDAGDTIGPADVIRLLAEQTGLAEHLLTLDRRLDVETVRQSLARRVIGQPAAIEAASDLIFRIRAGLTDPARPYAVYLFTGPTGTGKTELAKSIAEYLFGDPTRLTRFDMSEYAGPDAAARLIGDRWSPDGQLTRRLREQPFAVVLLDEIEKAHRSVLNLLLQVFDEGRLTDAAGNSASFQQTVIIMTSNLGARSTLPIGFGERSQAIMADVDRAVRDFFPPELFNRIDRVVPFAPLTTEVAEQIATKELARLLGRRGLTERNVFVYANQAVRERIVAEAFDARYGARTVKRYLEHEIGSLLIDELNRAERAPMRVMRLYDSDGAFRLHVEPLVEAEPVRAAWLLDGAIELPALQLWPLLDESMRLLETALDRRGPKPTVADARYYQDRLDNHVTELREQYEAHRRHAGEPDPELLEVDAFSHDELPDPSGLPSRPLRRIRRFDRRAMAPRGEALGRDQLLRQIGEACLFARCADRIGEPGMHDAWVELLRVGQVGEPRPVLPGPGLLDWMLQAYAVPGYVERIGARFPDGRTGEIKGDASLDTLGPDGMQRPIHAVVHISGLFAREAYAGEEGCHIWRSFSTEPEIVRVRLLDAPAGATPRDQLGAHAESVDRFERALEKGTDPLPENPERMLPTVRTLTFRPPLRPREVFEVEVEDFHVGWAGRRKVTALSQVLLDLWLLRMSRRPEP